MVSILPPHVVHDGRPANADGYRKRVIYIEPEVIGEVFIGSAVDRPALPDISLRNAVSALDEPSDASMTRSRRRRDSIWSPSGSATSMGGSPSTDQVRPDRRASRRGGRGLPRVPGRPPVRARDDGGRGRAARRRARPISPEASRRRSGSPRTPTSSARRLETARDRILAGQPLADVATEVGFFDQAHLTRRFKRFLGVTPGRFLE